LDELVWELVEKIIDSPGRISPANSHRNHLGGDDGFAGPKDSH
jgi:hypothetical protein